MIRQSNDRVWRAIAAVRLSREPSTMSELYDALDFRRYSRSYDAAFAAALTSETDSDLRAYGRVERSYTELYRAALVRSVNRQS